MGQLAGFIHLRKSVQLRLQAGQGGFPRVDNGLQRLRSSLLLGQRSLHRGGSCSLVCHFVLPGMTPEMLAQDSDHHRPGLAGEPT
jgi:hypothetical protein